MDDVGDAGGQQDPLIVRGRFLRAVHTAVGKLQLWLDELNTAMNSLAASIRTSTALMAALVWAAWVLAGLISALVLVWTLVQGSRFR